MGILTVASQVATIFENLRLRESKMELLIKKMCMDLKGPPLVDLIKSQNVSKEAYARLEEVKYGPEKASYGPE